jgi:N utilization substance protein A
MEIAYTAAVKIEPDFEEGEEVSEAFPLLNFGRREILAIRQNLQSKVQEYEKDNIYKKYKEKIGEVIAGEVYQAWKKEILVIDDEGIELVLPKSEQIPADFYRKGDSIRAVVSKVELRNNSPVIVLSRTSPVFLERLLESEVPEVYDGLITIRNIVRVPGERAKIAVESYDDRIDPVGACVGMKGSRIHGIVRELRNENIDIINYTSNPSLYIQRSLSPAKISSITLDDDTKRADVFMKPDQVSLAIGKGGYNIKLAGKLTGYEIDVYRDTDVDNEDVDLDEFGDEIDQWIIDEFKNIGCDTAKSVLTIGVEELVKRTDLEEETIREVIRILKSEFD